MKIVLIHDGNNLRHLKRSLEQRTENFEVKEFDDVFAVFRFLSKVRDPALVFVDFYFQEKSGVESANNLKTNLPHIPIIGVHHKLLLKSKKLWSEANVEEVVYSHDYKRFDELLTEYSHSQNVHQ